MTTDKKTPAANVCLPSTYKECVDAGISLTMHQHANYVGSTNDMKDILFNLIVSEFHGLTTLQPAFVNAKWVLDTAIECGAPRLTAYRMAMFSVHLWYDNFETDGNCDRIMAIKEAFNKLAVELCKVDEEIRDDHR